MLSETYSVIHYAGVWGCNRPTAAASVSGSMTASVRKHGRSHRYVAVNTFSNCSGEFNSADYESLIQYRYKDK